MVKNLADFEELKAKIYTLRGTKVILDRDLAALYDVETRALNQSVKRNPERFPNDFMFQLTRFEWESVRSQFVISKYQTLDLTMKNRSPLGSAGHFA